MLADGVVEGRRVFANTIKYVLMATSSNFGNMFSAAVASVFLSFLPMLPSQILLNNLLYNAGQLAIPTDAVDDETLARPAAWDLGFVRRFMIVFGPVSSLFDFLDLLRHAGPSRTRVTASSGRAGSSSRSRRRPSSSTSSARAGSRSCAAGRACSCSSCRHMLRGDRGGRAVHAAGAAILGFSPLPLVFFLLLLGMIADLPRSSSSAPRSSSMPAQPHPFAKPPIDPPRTPHTADRAAGRVTSLAMAWCDRGPCLRPTPP